MASTPAYTVEYYVAASGRSPFLRWFEGLESAESRARVQVRIDRMQLGDLGDCRAIAGRRGLFEARLHFGAGYRIYYALVGRRILLLLVGGTKRSQTRDIQRAAKYLAHFREED